MIKLHYNATEERIPQSQSNVILCFQDTSELDFNGQQIKDMGRLSYGAQKGMCLHPTLCITPERLPLGITDVWQWARGKTKKDDQK